MSYTLLLSDHNASMTLKKTEDGTTFTDLTYPFPEGRRGMDLLNLNGDIYALGGSNAGRTTFYGEVWKSSDKGISWTKIGNMPSKETASQSCYCFVFNNLLWVVMSGQNTWSSPDGITWTQKNIGLNNLPNYGFVVFSSSRVDILNYSGVASYSTNGYTWANTTSHANSGEADYFINGKYYIVGGYYDSTTYNQSIMIKSFLSDSSFTNSPFPFSYANGQNIISYVFDTNIFVVDTDTSILYKWDSTTKTWTNLGTNTTLGYNNSTKGRIYVAEITTPNLTMNASSISSGTVSINNLSPLSISLSAYSSSVMNILINLGAFAFVQNMNANSLSNTQFIITALTNKIEGQVTSQGVGVSNAKIVAINDDLQHIYNTISDANGYYSLPIAIQGIYTVYVTYKDVNGNLFTSLAKPSIQVGGV